MDFCFREKPQSALGFANFPKRGKVRRLQKKKNNSYSRIAPNPIMVTITPTHSSPGALELCACSQSFVMHDRMKGPGIVFTTGSPQVPSPTTWRPSWKSTCLLWIDDLAITMSFYKEKRLLIWNKTPFSFLGNVFRRQHELEGERERGLATRGSISCISGHSMTIFGCDSSWKNDAWWTLWYLKMRWVVLKVFLVTATITGLRPFVIQVMRCAKWGITRPWRSDVSISWKLCATEPHMLSISRPVSRWTTNLNGFQSLPDDYS